MFKSILMNMADSIGDVFFLNKHFVALKDVSFPEGLLKRRKTVKYFQKIVFFYLDNLSHSVSSCF